MAYLTLIPLAGAWLNHRQKKSTYYLVLLPSAIIALVGLLQALTSVIPIPPRSDITTRLHGWSAMGETIRKIDRQTNQRVLFIAQGAPLTALVAFYGLLPPNRIAEVNGKGQWKYWWMNWDKSYIEPPFGSDAVFVDDNRNSEVNFIASFYQEKLASESILIKKNNRELRTLNFTHFRNYLGGLNFDLLKAN
ncbi:hypothetical protein HYY75_08035, partial [bacterium]|nr:hypothetical protein [bacterium]